MHATFRLKTRNALAFAVSILNCGFDFVFLTKTRCVGDTENMHFQSIGSINISSLSPYDTICGYACENHFSWHLIFSLPPSFVSTVLFTPFDAIEICKSLNDFSSSSKLDSFVSFSFCWFGVWESPCI